MEILIPVTRVFRQQKQVRQIQPKMDDRMERQRAKTQKDRQFNLESGNLQISNKTHRVKSNKVHIKNQNQDQESYQNFIHLGQRQNDWTFNSEEPKFQKHHGKIDCQLSKKSTRSSLHQNTKVQNLELQEASSSHMVISKVETRSKEKEDIQAHLQLERDQFNAVLESSCKICLNGENQSQRQSNPLVRACKCKDFVHVECLQEWINHRDLMNGRSQINQCQVCKQLYHFKLCTEAFLSLKIFRKKVSSSPFTIAFRFILMLTLFVFSAFCIYLFIQLLNQESQNGGYVRQTLNVPYGTCLVIIILISIVSALIFVILAHNFVTTLCLGFKYKIGKITQQNSKQSSRNLNNLFSEVR